MDDACINEYNLERLIWKDISGEYFFCTKKDTKEKFIIKRYKNDLLNDKRIKSYMNNEIFILRNIFHENIIKYCEFKKGNSYIYIIFEFCNGGNLKDCLNLYQAEYNKPFPQKVIQHISNQIISALSYLHKGRILHRNIKLENIFVHFPTEQDKNQLNMLSCKIKIKDFFFARYLRQNNLAKSIVGTPYNMDPYLLN